jgi:hypothetical protein
MFRAFADEDTVVRSEMGNQDVALHGAISTSSYAPSAAVRASSRFSARASWRAERRFSISSSRVAPWE